MLCHVLTGARKLPRYYHRTLNLPKLADIKFTHIPRNTTLARMIKTNELPAVPVLEGAGLREMEERDVEAVEDLFKRYMRRFKMAPEYSVDEVRHNLLSGRGKGEVGANGCPGRRAEQVTWTYVVEVCVCILVCACSDAFRCDRV